MKKGLLVLVSSCFLMLCLLPTESFARSQSKNLAKSRAPRSVSAISRAGQWGVGLMLGDPSGISVKYWQDDKTAFDFALGSQLGVAGIGIHADYLLHMYPFEEAQEAPIYVGGGLFLGGSDTLGAGARGVFGICYLFDEPFDIFFELAPKFVLAPDLGFTMSLALGGRIYF